MYQLQLMLEISIVIIIIQFIIEYLQCGKLQEYNLFRMILFLKEQ